MSARKHPTSRKHPTRVGWVGRCWHDRAVPSVLPAVELLGRPESGRIFTIDGRVRLGDVDRDGVLRLDSTARFLQDAATDDASDAGLDRRFGWLVRRSMIDAGEPARLGESISVSTWCTGMGRCWAERRSQIVGDGGALIDAVSLWVQVDVATGRPVRLADDFQNAYSDAAAGRTVSSRLSLGAPTTVDPTTVDPESWWHVRRTDLDPFGHVNNAATWAFLEEFAPLGDRRGRAELEYLQPVEHGTTNTVVVDAGTSFDAWLLHDDAVGVAARWTPRTGRAPSVSGG